MKYFEDVRVGETAVLGSSTVSEAEMLAFARKYDPQPFHTDPEAAKTSFFGGLIASGWHTCAIMMRISVEAMQREQAAGAGSPGIDSTEIRIMIAQVCQPLAIRPPKKDVFAASGSV